MFYLILRPLWISNYLVLANSPNSQWIISKKKKKKEKALLMPKYTVKFYKYVLIKRRFLSYTQELGQLKFSDPC